MDIQIDGDAHANESAAAHLHAAGQDAAGGEVGVVLEDAIMRDDGAGVDDDAFANAGV